ncbi:DUF6788 family protein [Ferrimicrobium acidiphilum]|uniref:DUF6788 family protein n=1 Tax=Ferrimicrobium acidiphilum TaxID=121039 RepID=A0ABV3Y6G6_9ACTN
MLRGTVVNNSRRCGKPNCRCAAGEALHVRTVLSYSKASRTRFLTLPQEMVEPVRQATQRYREARARLEAQGEAGLTELVNSLSPHSRARSRTRSQPQRRSTSES